MKKEMLVMITLILIFLALALMVSCEKVYDDDIAMQDLQRIVDEELGIDVDNSFYKDHIDLK